jgi:hypothetical protein
MEQVVSGKLGGLGLTLWQMVAARGITSKSGVWELAHENGHEVSRQTVYNYFSGNQPMPRSFLQALDKALEFSEEEKAELVRQFSSQARNDKEIREIVEAAEVAFNLNSEDNLRMGWVYLWGDFEA